MAFALSPPEPPLVSEWAKARPTMGLADMPPPS
jgi:hypothetical protein